MEKLIVSNFLNLKYIELELSKINIIIGPQAQGKSIVAKLVFFFKNFFFNYRISILVNQTKTKFDQFIIREFKKIFPEYSWENQDFEIIYQLYNYQIKLTTKSSIRSRRKLLLDYSGLSIYRKKLTKKLDKNWEEIKQNTDSVNLEIIQVRPSFEIVIKEKYLEKYFTEDIFKSESEKNIKEITYIPFGRAFFANIQKNIFSFLSQNINIDYFLARFGSAYEKIPQLYDQIYNQEIELEQAGLDENDKLNLEAMISKIIAGKYLYENSQDWINCSADGRKISLANASSGQQEALPMLMILATLPFIDKSSNLFFIEEPEAHLFPKSQKNIIELISLVFNLTEKRNQFFITTHSPYILTAFNILVQAANTLESAKKQLKSKDHLKQLFQIVPENLMLDINDISVYTIENGKIKSIINHENKLIDTNIIDEVSNEFSDVFEKLINLEFGK